MTTDDTIRGLEERLRAGLEGLPAGPWEVYDGCSWRRIGTTGRGYDDCGVLYPCNASDGHPDLSSRQGDRDAILEHFALCSPENILALLDALRTLTAQLEEAGAERDALIAGMSGIIHYQLRAEAAEARLEEAKAVLGRVYGDALEVSRNGAVPGHHFVRLAGAIVAIRAFLRQGGEDARAHSQDVLPKHQELMGGSDAR